MVRDMIAQHPGCIVSTLTYQDRLFDETVVRLNREGMLAWRARFLRWLEEIVPLYPPRVEVEISDLADQMTIIADGSISCSAPWPIPPSWNERHCFNGR